MSNDLIVYEAPKLLTEREVRIAGATSNRLCNLRGMLKMGVVDGALVSRTRNGSSSMTLPKEDIEALIALMIERDEAFLVGLNIELET